MLSSMASSFPEQKVLNVLFCCFEIQEQYNFVARNKDHLATFVKVSRWQGRQPSINMKNCVCKFEGTKYKIEHKIWKLENTCIYIYGSQYLTFLIISDCHDTKGNYKVKTKHSVVLLKFSNHSY